MITTYKRGKWLLLFDFFNFQHQSENIIVNDIYLYVPNNILIKVSDILNMQVRNIFIEPKHKNNQSNLTKS